MSPRKEGIMFLFKKVPMTFDGKDYEIRVLYDENTINVVAFLNNYPVNGFRHQMKLPKKCNVMGVLERDAANGLVHIAKDDIKQKRWDRVISVITENTPG
jgi:hypothetical protein